MVQCVCDMKHQCLQLCKTNSADSKSTLGVVFPSVSAAEGVGVGYWAGGWGGQILGHIFIVRGDV